MPTGLHDPKQSPEVVKRCENCRNRETHDGYICCSILVIEDVDEVINCPEWIPKEEE